MGPADLGDRRPVALGRLHGREGRPDDRFGDEGGDRVRSRGGDQAIELCGELLGSAERVRAGEPGPVRVGGRDVPEPSQPALVGPAERLAPGQVEGAEAVAVVAPPAGDDDPAVAVAVREVVRAGQLERGLDRLGAAGDRVDRRVVDGQVRADLRGVCLHGFGRERAAVGVGEARGLLGHDAGDLRAAVANVDDDCPAGRVKVLATVGVADRRTVRFDGDRWVGQGRTAEHGAGAHARMLADGAERRRSDPPETTSEPARSSRCRKYGGAVEGRPTEDAEAIARARGGDVAAYEELVRRYQDVALRTAYLVCPETDADDAVQEAFLKAHAALPRFRDGAPFRPWLLRIVANEARNRRRSAGRRTGLAQRAADVAGPWSNHHPSTATSPRRSGRRSSRRSTRCATRTAR